MKKLWLAALLNLIPVPIPLGHTYLDRGDIFWAIFARCVAFGLGAFLIVVGWVACEFNWGGGCGVGDVAVVWWFLAAVPVVVVLAFNAVSAFGLAEEAQADDEAFRKRAERFH